MAHLSNFIYCFFGNYWRLGNHYQQPIDQGAQQFNLFLKAFSVLFVAAIIFAYYLDDVRRETPQN